MSAFIQLLGFAALTVWARLQFGLPSAFLVAGLALLVVGLALSDTKAKLPTKARKPRRPADMVDY